MKQIVLDFAALPHIAQGAIACGFIGVAILIWMCWEMDHAEEEPKCDKCNKYITDCQCWKRNQGGDGV